MTKCNLYSIQGGSRTILAWLLSAMLLLTGLTSCVKEDPSACPPGMGDFYLSMSVAPQSTFRQGEVPLSELQEKLKNAENKVKSVRVLVFDHATGACLVNQILGGYTQPKDNTTAWSHPVLIPGNVQSFDFYFVANEASKTYNLTTALQGVTEREQLYSLSGLTQIPWQPEFLPKLAEGGGEDDLIPMTAVCPNVSIDAIKQMLGKGTERDPYRFLAESGKRTPVLLTRVLARVDIKIPSVMVNSTPGDRTTDEVLALSYIDKFEMSLVNVPRYFSLFASRYYNANQWTTTIYNPISSNFYQDPRGGYGCYYVERNKDKVQRNMASTDGAGGAIGWLECSDFYTTLYVPEFIRQTSADAGLTPDQLAAMQLRLTFQVNDWDPKHRNGYQVTRHPLVDKFDDRTTEEAGQLAAQNAGVSTYSVIRNTWYQIKITQREFEYSCLDADTLYPTYVSYAMKRYRYITLSLLLLLLSLSSLSAQKDYQLKEKSFKYLIGVKTTPSYCQNYGTMEIRLLDVNPDAPLHLSQIGKVEYDVRAQDVIDLYGKPVTPNPSLIIAPTNGEPIDNRLFDFRNIYVHLNNPLTDRIDLGFDAYLSPAYHTYLFTTKGYDNKSLNALAGMRVTLVRAPEGYEEFQKSREDYYYRKPDPTKTDDERFGGGMIRLGETIELSSTFTNANTRENLYPFRFLYIEGKKGQRVVYPYNNENGTRNLKSIITEDKAKLKYMSEHLMPKGVYRFKFEHPCQPGESFYINIDMTEPPLEPKLTKPLEPVVDYVSCDETWVYPFADGRLDYGVDENGRPRNLVFYVTGLPKGDSRYLYFFPFDSKGNPIDHTKFYIPLKNIDLDPANPKINLRYFYLQSTYQWIIYDKRSSNSVYSVGVDQFVKNELQGGNNSDYNKLPNPSYIPTNDIYDWGKDGTNGDWREWPYLPWVSVDVPINVTKVIPSYSRPTYVGYRCSKETGYMEFKFINIPTRKGSVVLKDGKTVIKSEDLSKLTDLMVRWDLAGDLKNEYTLEITTSPCPGAQDMPTEKLTVKLIDITEGIEVTFSPRRGLCPGETVTLTASNLGIPNENYTWKITKPDGSSVSRTGRIVSCDVVAPCVINDEVQYNSYTLTVSGTKCGSTPPQEGIIPVSPDELWWMPDLNGQGSGTLPGGPDEDDKPIDPNPGGTTTTTVGPEYYNWHNPDNWAFLYKGKFYPAKAVPSGCTNTYRAAV